MRDTGRLFGGYVRSSGLTDQASGTERSLVTECAAGDGLGRAPKEIFVTSLNDAYYRCEDRRPGRLHAGRRVRSQPFPCCPTSSLTPKTDEFDVPEAALTTLNATISGVRATVALIAKPEASKPSRVMPRTFIDEHPFADGLVGSVEFVAYCVFRSKVNPLLC
jgi:hypothetical protein